VRRRTCVSVVLLMALITAGCGSRRTEGELVAAAGGQTASGLHTPTSTANSAAAPAGETAGTDTAGPAAPDAAVGSGTALPSAAPVAAGAAPAASGGPQPAGPATPAGRTASAARSISGAAPAHAANGNGGPAAGGGSAGPSNTVAAGPPRRPPVSIGTLGAWSGVVGQSQGPYLAGLRAWIRMINDHGGLAGHPVNQLIVADDGGDSARNRQLAQQLIEGDHVLALMFDGSLDGSGTVSYVQEQRVPFIGGIGDGQAFYTSPMYFPQMPQGDVFAQTLAGGAQLAVSRGKTKFATIACAEAKTCSQMMTAVKNGARRAGGQVVYAAQASIAAPDYSAECLNAHNAGAEVIAMAMAAAAQQRIAQSCSRQGYHPLYLTSSVVVAPDMPKNDDLQGMVITAPTMPVAASQPALREFLDAMARYAPNEPLVDGQVEAWLTGKVLELAGRNLPDGDDVTTLRNALLQGLWTIHGTDLGITAPLEYNANAPASPTVCWFFETIQNHHYTSDGSRTCAPFDRALVS